MAVGSLEVRGHSKSWQCSQDSKKEIGDGDYFGVSCSACASRLPGVQGSPEAVIPKQKVKEKTKEPGPSDKMN